MAEFAAPSGLTTGPVPDPRYAGWLAHALDLARASGQLGEVPVGAVIVDGAGEIIGTGAGAWDDKAGACGSVWDLVRDRRANHWVEVVGALDEAGCGGVLREFFEARR